MNCFFFIMCGGGGSDEKTCDVCFYFHIPHSTFYFPNFFLSCLIFMLLYVDLPYSF